MVMVRSCQLAYGGRYQNSGSGGSTVHIISLRLVLPHLYYYRNVLLYMGKVLFCVSRLWELTDYSHRNGAGPIIPI